MIPQDLLEVTLQPTLLYLPACAGRPLLLHPLSQLEHSTLQMMPTATVFFSLQRRAAYQAGGQLLAASPGLHRTWPCPHPALTLSCNFRLYSSGPWKHIPPPRSWGHDSGGRSQSHQSHGNADQACFPTLNPSAVPKRLNFRPRQGWSTNF